MSKRLSGPPRRPRDPIAKNARIPFCRQRVERDRRRPPLPPYRRDPRRELEQTLENGEGAAEKDADDAG